MIDSVADPEIELEILDLLESNGASPLERLSRLLEFSELEISAALGQLVTKEYVGEFGNNFKITFAGKLHLGEVRNANEMSEADDILASFFLS